MKFVELTRFNSGRVVFVNLENVVDIEEKFGGKKSYSELGYTNGRILTVKETPEEIFAKPYMLVTEETVEDLIAKNFLRIKNDSKKQD